MTRTMTRTKALRRRQRLPRRRHRWRHHGQCERSDRRRCVAPTTRVCRRHGCCCRRRRRCSGTHRGRGRARSRQHRRRQQRQVQIRNRDRVFCRCRCRRRCPRLCSDGRRKQRPGRDHGRQCGARGGGAAVRVDGVVNVVKVVCAVVAVGPEVLLPSVRWSTLGRAVVAVGRGHSTTQEIAGNRRKPAQDRAQARELSPVGKWGARLHNHGMTMKRTSATLRCSSCALCVGSRVNQAMCTKRCEEPAIGHGATHAPTNCRQSNPLCTTHDRQSHRLVPLATTSPSQCDQTHCTVGIASYITYTYTTSHLQWRARKANTRSPGFALAHTTPRDTCLDVPKSKRQ